RGRGRDSSVGVAGFDRGVHGVHRIGQLAAEPVLFSGRPFVVAGGAIRAARRAAFLAPFDGDGDGGHGHTLGHLDHGEERIQVSEVVWTASSMIDASDDASNECGDWHDQYSVRPIRFRHIQPPPSLTGTVSRDGPTWSTVVGRQS
ncbi:MAG TPA: hypothetical protein VGF11_00425, partial [Acidimicrobiales bacterium]